MIYNMKFLSLCVGALALSSCSSEDIIEKTSSSETEQTLKLNVMESKEAAKTISRVSLTEKPDRILAREWDASDKVSIFALNDGKNIYGGQGTEAYPYLNSNPEESHGILTNTKEKGHAALFTGAVKKNSYPKGQDFILFYPKIENMGGNEIYNRTTKKGEARIDGEASNPTEQEYYYPDLLLNLAEQDGKLETVQEKHLYLIGKGKIESVNESSSEATAYVSKMNQLPAILKIYFEGIEGQGITKIEIKNVISSVTVSFAQEKIFWKNINAEQKPVTITPGNNGVFDSRKPVYVALFAADAQANKSMAPQFTVTVENGTIYTAQLKQGVITMGSWYDKVPVKLKKRVL